jgi:site-specific DNA recombinase
LGFLFGFVSFSHVFFVSYFCPFSCPILLYHLRVSTQGQVETQTIEQQIVRVKEHIKNQGWLLDPEHIYRDDGHSGAKLARPGLDSLRDRAVFAEFDVVVITDPDRLARNYVHLVLVLDELEQRGVRVEFLDRPMSDDPHDRLLLQIRGAVAEYERTLIADRMRRGRLMKYKAGKLVPWTKVPYGYRLDPEGSRNPEHVYIDETEAAIVVQMFNWYLEPKSTLYQVAKRLTDMGLPTPDGKERWSTSTVRRILKNTAYTGTAYANRTQTQQPKQRRSALQKPGARGETQVMRPEKEWIPISVPAIIDKDLFERVQQKLSYNRQTSPRNNKSHQYLLRGLVSCGLCRLSARARTVPPKYHYYVCRGHCNALQFAQKDRCTARYIPVQQLDDLVWKDLCKILAHPDMIKHTLERAHGRHWIPQELQARIDRLTKAKRQITQQQKRLLDAYLMEIIDVKEFERKRTELEKKHEVLRAEKAQLEASTAERLEISAVVTSIEAFCAQIQPVLEEATFEQKRQLVELLIDRVVVLDEQVEIRYVVPTQPDGPHVPFCQLYADYRRNVR